MANTAIRPLTLADRDAALAVINEAARWYREFLPPEEYHEPEMTPAVWEAETRRMVWYGASEDGRLVGVMALEHVRDAALLRHAYILPEHQRRGIGSSLLRHLEAEVRGVQRIVVGTYRSNHKARSALARAGYRLSADPEAVLRTYYTIPEDRLRSSVTYEKVPVQATGGSAVSIVQEFTGAFNRQDVAGLVACFTGGATYDDGFYGRHAGRAALRGMFERMFREGRDYAWTMETVVESPRAAVAEWSFGYTVTDAIPRSVGRHVRFRGMSLFELEHGRIAAYREYFDRGAALLQLGFEPESLARVLRRREPAR